nr:DNA repair protein RadA [Bacilli bacterium]
MKKVKTHYVCQECGAESVKWLGRCPSCGEYGTMIEEVVTQSEPVPTLDGAAREPMQLNQIVLKKEPRFSSGSEEFNRVLGGGILPGELFLVGGDPGIGKSTLLLQTAHKISQTDHTVLYVTGEESMQQVKLRAMRIGSLHDGLYVLADTSIDQIEKQVKRLRPLFVVIDSIQTMYAAELPSAPGSIQQVRTCTMRLLTIAKELSIAICIVGHVTKDGAIAGPRLLEHMVDAVLYFEGDRHHRYRVLRAVKNRFGSADEIGVFDMRSDGLCDVLSPSAMFLAERSIATPGSTVVASLEGSRPVLVEIQALVSPTHFPSPRRMASGLDYNRVTLLMAVLEKRVGLYLQNFDAYVNVAGGLKIDEPAVDLGVAVAIASSFRDHAVATGTVFAGEVGLTGEVRAIARLDARLSEAKKLGFVRMIAPVSNLSKSLDGKGIEVVGVATLQEAIAATLGRN